MSLRKIYENNINRKSKIVDYISEDFIIKTKVKNLWNLYKYIIIMLLIGLIIILILSFNNIYSIFSVITLIISIILLSIFFNSYSIIGKKNELTIKTNGQKIKIPYSNLKNIYLEENNFRIFFKKYSRYSLIILYKTPANNICDISLPVLLLREKNIEKLFNCIKVKDCNINYQESCSKYKIKRFIRKAILFIILTLIALIIYFIV